MSKDEAQNLECILCPVKGGAMKKVNLPKNCKFIQNLEKIRKNEFDLEKNKYNSICIIPKLNNNILNTERAWVHLSCALWNPDIEIKEINGNTNIKFIDDISYDKFMNQHEIEEIYSIKNVKEIC